MGLRGLALLLVLSVLPIGSANAQEAGTPAPEPGAAPEPVDPQLESARKLFLEGVSHVKREEWAEALAAFERSTQARPHATTTFNIAACERALGQYTRAQRSFERALGEAREHPDQLSGSLVAEAKALSSQIDQALARAEVTLDPPNAAIAVDGRPLSFSASGAKPVAVAGVLNPGPGKPPPAKSFVLILNPGVHILTLSRKGYGEAVVNRSFRAGSRTELSLELAKLPATIRVSSNVDRALVRVDGIDMGPAPIDVHRPAGTYPVVVFRRGYDDYEGSVSVRAGEEITFRAKLKPESRPITKEWWFWTAAVAVVAGGALATYALTRPEPEPPPYDGGNTNWVARPAGARF